MKKSKKIKLITSLSTIAPITAVASAFGIGAAKNTTVVKQNNVLTASTVDITTLSWVIRNVYSTNNTDQIKSIVEEDNMTLFAKFRNLKTAATITFTYKTAQTQPIQIVISADTAVYTGSKTWKASYHAPEPTPTPTPTPVPGIISILYEDLAELKNAENLPAGQQYRITDYAATVSSSLTNAKAASKQYPFDIIITAESESTFSENVTIQARTDASYTTKANFDGWTVQYSFDNDTTRFNWADSENGKGVIYYMKDEYGNEAPYDFKNIQFKAVTEYDKTTVTRDTNWRYTFSVLNGSTYEDATINANTRQKVVHNTINAYTRNGVNYLNCIVMNNTSSSYAYNNSFGYNCHDITLGIGCSSNKFSDDCSIDILGEECCDNTFGNSFNENVIGNVFNSNTFGNNCNNNVIENLTDQPAQKGNTFSAGTYEITITSNYSFENNIVLNCYQYTFTETKIGQLLSNLHSEPSLTAGYAPVEGTSFTKLQQNQTVRVEDENVIKFTLVDTVLSPEAWELKVNGTTTTTPAGATWTGDSGSRFSKLEITDASAFSTSTQIVVNAYSSTEISTESLIATFTLYFIEG